MELKKLWDLQEVDKILEKISREITQRELVLKLKEMQGKIKELEGSVHSEKKEIKALEDKAQKGEKEIKEMEFTQKELEKKLYSGDINLPKELEGIKEKIDKIKQKINGLEEMVLVNMDKVEDKEQFLNQTVGSLEEIKKKYYKGVKLYQKTKKELEIKKEKALKKQEELKNSFPEKLLIQYQKIQKLYKNNGIARIENGMCSGCRVEIPVMQLKSIKEGNTIYTCEQCGRIIIAWNE